MCLFSAPDCGIMATIIKVPSHIQHRTAATWNSEEVKHWTTIECDISDRKDLEDRTAPDQVIIELPSVADEIEFQKETQADFADLKVKRPAINSLSQNRSSVKSDPTEMVPSSEGAALVPSLVFAIPLPPPSPSYQSPLYGTQLPFLVYTLPRSVYEKPPKDATTGKRPSEKIIKKIQRSWQTSLCEGDDIKRGDLGHPSIMKRCMGACFRSVGASLRFITGSSAQILARLPSNRKIDRILILYSCESSNLFESDVKNSSKFSVLTQKQAEEGLTHTLRLAQKEAQTRALISGLFLPIALAAEIYVPLIFELTLVYFSVQYRAWRKAKFLVKKATEEPSLTSTTHEASSSTGDEIIAQPQPSPTFEFHNVESEMFREIERLVCNQCSQLDPHKFPPLDGRASPETNTGVEFTPDANDGLKSNTLANASPAKLKPSVHSANSEMSLQIRLNSTGRSSFSDRNSSSLGRDQEEGTKHKKDGGIQESTQSNANNIPATKSRIIEVIPIGDNSRVETTFCATDENSATNPRSNDGEIPESVPPNKKHVPHVEIASFLIQAFVKSLPPNTVTRHELNERRVAEDFNRVMKKATKEYVRSIKKNKKKESGQKQGNRDKGDTEAKKEKKAEDQAQSKKEV